MSNKTLPILQTRAEFNAGSWNSETRTIDLTWTTGARGLRSGWDGPYYEELAVSPEAVRLERLNAGASLLNSHKGRDLKDIIGVVERAWIQDGLGHATVRLSGRAEMAGIVQDIVDGIIRNVSVGYRVHRYEQVERVDDVPVYRATDWEPMEISMVPIGFDVGAQVRESEHAFEVEVVEAEAEQEAREGDVNPLEETPMDEVIQPGVERTAPAVDPVVTERKRASEILNVVRTAKLGDEFAQKLIDDGVTVDAAREAVIGEWAKKDAARSTVNVQVTRDEVESVREGVVEAVLHRAMPSQFKATDKAGEMRGMSLIDLARESVERAGGRTRGLSKMEIASAALNLDRTRAGMHSTSDFPVLLAQVVNRVLRRAYEAAPQTWRPLTREASAPDFRDMHRLQLSGAVSLEKVGEGAEFKYATLPDGSQIKYALATFGKILAVTRQVLVNDDLNYFGRIPEIFGRAAADLESDTVWGLINDNVVLEDGKALFHADHGNLGTAAAISVGSLSEARKLMRLQKDLDGKLINIQGRYLVVPAALETVAEQMIAARTVVPTKNVDANPFTGAFQVIVEPRLDAKSALSWYLFADPAAVDTIEVAYLEGQRGLYIESREGFEVDGLEIKARLDFGAKVIDHRGMFKNPGA